MSNVAKKTKKKTAKKSAPRKTTKKSASRKTAKKGSQRKTYKTTIQTKSRNTRPRFPGVRKGSRALSRSAATTTKAKNGRITTKIVTRTYRENPMGDVGTMATLLIFGFVGAVGGELLDRYIATMPRSVRGADAKPLNETEAAMAIAIRPDAMRMGAQGGLALLLGALTYYLAKKGKRLPSIIVGGLAFGVAVRGLLQAYNAYMAPAMFKASEDPATPNFGSRMFYAEQDRQQDALIKILDDVDKAMAGKSGNTTAAELGHQGGRLAGISQRMGANAGQSRAPSSTVLPARPAAVAGLTEATRPAALPEGNRSATAAPPQRVGQLAFSPADQESSRLEKGSLGCGGPSCGPSCSCGACKAVWGSGAASDLFTRMQEPTVSRVPPFPGSDSGASPIPEPADRGAPLVRQISGIQTAGYVGGRKAARPVTLATVAGRRV